MKLNVYAVMDNKIGIYSHPHYFQRDALAVRTFGQMALDSKTQIGATPLDYSLWRIAEYDDEKGEFINSRPECVSTAIQAANMITDDRKKATAALFPTGTEVQQ